MTLPRLWNGFSEMRELSTCDRKTPARLTNVTMARAKLLNLTSDTVGSAKGRLCPQQPLVSGLPKNRQLSHRGLHFKSEGVH